MVFVIILRCVFFGVRFVGVSGLTVMLSCFICYCRVNGGGGFIFFIRLDALRTERPILKSKRNGARF
jgi:hypothetical protein